MATPQEDFDGLTATVSTRPGVTPGTGFGARPGLRVQGRIFVMLVDDEVVLKLPASRCAQLVADGVARRFDANRGRPMREWVVLAASAGVALAGEAYDFVAGG